MKKIAHVKNYDKIADEFGQNLISKLRNHSLDYDFLDFWVPDDDISKGIESMIESAMLSNYEGIEIGFNEISNEIRNSKSNLSNEIISRANKFGEAKFQDYEKGLFLVVDKLSPKKNQTIQNLNLDKYSEVHKGVLKDSTDSNLSMAVDFDIDPQIRNYLSNIKDKFCYENKPLDKHNDNFLTADFKDMTISLCFDIETLKIEDISFAKTKDKYLNILLNKLCSLSMGVPIQEFADHNLLKVIRQLEEEIINNSGDKTRLRKGVLLPHNCGSSFIKIQQIIRLIYNKFKDNHKIKEEINFYYIEPDEYWINLDKKEKEQLLIGKLDEFAEIKRFNVENYMNFVELRANRYGFDVRSVFNFNELANTDVKPNLLRELEIYLRQNLDKSIEVIAEKAKDKSPLRRL